MNKTSIFNRTFFKINKKNKKKLCCHDTHAHRCPLSLSLFVYPEGQHLQTVLLTLNYNRLLWAISSSACQRINTLVIKNLTSTQDLSIGTLINVQYVQQPISCLLKGDRSRCFCKQVSSKQELPQVPVSFSGGMISGFMVKTYILNILLYNATSAATCLPE